MRGQGIGRKRTWGIGLLVWGLTAAFLAVAPHPGLAHKGHAGPMITFLKEKEALKAMLPEGAKISRRKEALKADGVAWAKDALGVGLEAGVYPYFLARDRESGKPLAAAVVWEVDYEHADVQLALGLDASGHVTGAAVLGTNEMYVPEFKDGPGAGMLADLKGATVKDLAARAASVPESDEAGQFTLARLRDMGALMAAFLHGMQA
jgi:hypothetical protein